MYNTKGGVFMFEKYNIGEIRILTTSSELEFNTEAEIREYLRYTLPKEEEGKYWYRERGIDVNDKEILVIFWYRNKGIGCGILHSRDKEEGFLRFYPETIFNISSITEDEIHRFSEIPVKVKQGSPKVDIAALNDILNLIYEKWRSYS